MKRHGGIVLAAGRSSRMGFDKVWAELNGRPVLVYSLHMMAAANLDELALVVSETRVEEAQRLIASLSLPARVRAGGDRRRDSVERGLAELGECDWVVVHDAARPLAPPGLVGRGLEAARASGAAVPVVPLVDTVKQVREERVVQTVDREELWRVQTPQVFARTVLESALRSSDEDVGDEATLVERAGGEVRVFQGAEQNIKLTTPWDLRLAEALLRLEGG